MTLLSFSDLHGDAALARRISAEIASADMILLTGDLTQFGGAEDAQRAIDPFHSANPNLLTVPGNCDHAEVETYLRERQISIDGILVVKNRIAFVGVGGSLPCPGLGTPLEQKEDAFENRLGKIIAVGPGNLPLILVTHQPPYDTVTDLAGAGRHVGSKSIRRFIEKHHPLICFTGHIHEGRGIDRIGDTQIVNPGPFRQGRYAYARVANDKVEALEIRSVG